MLVIDMPKEDSCFRRLIHMAHLYTQPSNGVIGEWCREPVLRGSSIHVKSDNRKEQIGLEACPSNQGAVDIRLRH